MGIRSLGKSKAKAALAKSNYIENTDLSIVRQDINKLENGEHSIRVDSVSASQSISIVSGLVLCDATLGNIIISMPNPSLAYSGGYSTYFSIAKKDSSSNVVTISPYLSESIAGDASFDLTMQNEVLSLVTDGTDWYLID